jgi:hypothetical protein
MACQGPRAGAGRIQQYAVEPNAEGQRGRCVQFNNTNVAQMKPLELFAHGSKSMSMAVGGHDQPIFSGSARQGWRFSPRSSAQIEDPVARLHIEKQGDRLRCFVLNRNIAATKRVGARWAAACYRECRLQKMAWFYSEPSTSQAFKSFVPTLGVVQRTSEPWRLIVSLQQGSGLGFAKSCEPALD